MSKKRFLIIITIILIFLIAISISFLYYDNKYIITFETGTDDKILNQYVDRNQKVQVPRMPIKEGYIFIEWQYEGKTFNFDTEIKEDIILTAKWIKEEYVKITFETGIDEKIEEKTLLKSSKINDLPILKKEGYEFIGWFIGNIKYNGEEINEDVILNAKFEKIKPEYKIGDKIRIIGCYSNTSFESNCNNTKAVGWDRVILDILEDRKYPYVIGNNYGVTGFFKADSIEKL